jgi:cytochrome c551
MRISPWLKSQWSIVNGQWLKINRLWTIDYGLLLSSFIFLSCSSKSAKYQQYYAQGQVLYEKNCSNCHQKNGKGLGLLYPPLAASDYFEKNFSASLCLMKHGTKGEIVVNGKEFNKPMPGVPSLTELEIAEIATYINNSWGREQGIVEINQVTIALNKCGIK